MAFEPYFPHVVGTLELAKQVLAPFPANRVGLLLDPPNFISADLYPQREEELRRLFRELGDRIQIVHFKDMKLDRRPTASTFPAPAAAR